MDIKLEPGLYVVAVSGGVDSMALLNMLSGICKGNTWKLVVAHFDHGMRPDSEEDRRLVKVTAEGYGLPFIYNRTVLGEGASEATARRARYEFLHKVRLSSGASAIVTAQHQDDLIETAMINLLRGTGRHGLTSLKSTDTIKRPLLHLTKSDLVNYAIHHGIKWREDSTNTDPRYLRNYLRWNILPKVSNEDRQKLVQLIHTMYHLNTQIDSELEILQEYVRGSTSHITPSSISEDPIITDRYVSTVRGGTSHIDRKRFIMLPHAVAVEIMLSWLRKHEVLDITRPRLEKFVVAAKTLRSGRRVDVDKYLSLVINAESLLLVRRGDKALGTR